MRRAIAAVAAVASACATVPDESAGACSTATLRELVGRQASAELGSEAMNRSGASRLRWIRPGDIVTMDYSESRLNIHLDAQNKVERFVCG